MLISPSEYAFILRRDLTSFIERSFYELIPTTNLLMSSYIEAIAAKLEACRRGEIRRLIVNLPPRHLKSHGVSVVFPAWVLGHDPAMHVICASYGQELSEKFARDCRRLMQCRWYQALFPTRLSDERQAVHDYATTGQGTRMATSVDGPLTGRGADLIIIDDPLKPSDALSDTNRNKVNEWYDNTLLSRLNDKANGCIIIVMQRLHQDDLVGHVLEQGAGDWDVLSFPAIAKEDETIAIDSPFGKRFYKRNAGDALHPERESLATLSNIKKTIGEYNFASQYQQHPTPKGGNIVKTAWLRFYGPQDRPENFSWVLQSWDTANKASELNNYSVCTTWGILDGHFYLLDVFRQRLNFPDLRRKVIELAGRFHATTVLIEDKASGIQLIQDLQGELYGMKPYEAPQGADKLVRLHVQAIAFENGSVILPREAPWLEDYVTEITTFPGTKYDDQVDSTTQALDYMRNNNTLEIWAKLGR